MADLTLRLVKGSPLTNAELDANFSGLNTELASKLDATYAAMVASLGYTPANKAGDTFTGNVLVNAGADSRFLVQSSGVTQGQFQTTGSAVRLSSNNALPLHLSTNGVDRVTIDGNGNITYGGVALSGVHKFQGTNTGDLVVFEGTDASGTAAPDVVLYRNSSTPAAADQIGNFVFRGKDTGGADQSYARILGVIVDPTAGAEVGELRFGVQTLSGFNDLMALSSAGLSVTGGVTATQFNGSAAGLTDIKTINGNSLLGAADLLLFAGGITKVERVSALPGTPDATTLYIVTP